MKLSTLHDLFVHELQDAYSAEQQLAEALPKMAKAAHDPKLRSAFEKHLAETQSHLNDITDLLAAIDAKPGKVKCVAMAGIIKEGEELTKAEGTDSVLDAALIGAAQRAEHYEIAAYGTLSAFATLLGQPEAQKVIERILEQEHQADDKLTQIASAVNEHALRSKPQNVAVH